MCVGVGVVRQHTRGARGVGNRVEKSDGLTARRAAAADAADANAAASSGAASDGVIAADADAADANGQWWSNAPPDGIWQHARTIW